MKSTLLTTLLMCCMMLPVSAQKLTPTLLGVAGKDKTTNGKNLSYSIGELIVTTASNSSFYLTQGFQQPNWMIMGFTEFNPDIEFSVYPNPTVGLVNIYIKGLADFKNYQLTVYDLMGRLQKVASETEGQSNGTRILLDLSLLNPGQYFIRIIPGDAYINLIEFKIIKIE